MPWDDVAITGGVAVSAVISVLKRFGLREPWIGRLTWFAGLIWLILARVAGGEDWLRAAIGAAVVVLSAAGFYERVSKPAGKVLSSGS